MAGGSITSAAFLLRVAVLLVVAGAEAAADQQEELLYFTVSPAGSRAVEGQPVRLRCEAHAGGGAAAALEYSWILDGKPLAFSPRRHVQGPAGDLLISRLSRILDSGRFACRAKHSLTGTTIDSSTAKIDVQWISESSVHLQQPKLASHIRPGIKLELRCQVDGSGELKYEWFKNTKSVQSSARVETKRNLLLIAEARLEDNGVYRCLARNSAGASPVARTLALAVASNDSATIRVPPVNAIARRGEQARFSCAFDGAERIEWHFEEEAAPIEGDGERYVDEAGDLVIVAAQDKHKGFYSCQGFGPRAADRPQVYSAELQIAYLRSLADESLEPRLPRGLATVGEGQELQVACLAPAGLPSPKVFWRDPQQRLISDAGPVRVQDDTLVIAEARASRDQGNYSCVAENLAGSSALPLRVVVTRPPELLETPERAHGLGEDEPLGLSCTYKAMPPPYTRVSWLKDGERLAEAQPPARYKLVEQPGNSTLLFKAAQLTDRGSYACEIATEGWPAVRSEPTLLTIKEKLKFSPQPVDRRLELNSTAKVSCKAQGSSPPSIKWYKNGSTARFPKHVQESNGTLHFGGVLEDDKGNYTCVASNSQGQISHSIKIDVVIAPKFTVKPENVTATEGGSAMLHCSAEGDPKPTIHWDKDSQMNNMEVGERFVKLSNDSLYIKEVYLSDEGKYGCTAGNSGGLKREEVYLSVRAGEGGYRHDADTDAEMGDGSMMTKTVLVTLGAAAAYMLLVIGLMVYCRYRRRRRKQRYLQEQSDRAEKTAGQEQAREPEEVACDVQEVTAVGKPSSSSSGRRRDKHRESHKSDGTDTAHSQNSSQSKRSKSSYDKLAVSRSQLQEPMKPLGRGEFGEVFSAKFRPSGEGQQPQLVMVKTLTNSKDEGALQEFKRHLDLLHKLEHENLARLIGLCRDEEPDYMIIEYTDWGDLKQFLLASKAKEARAPQLSLPQILSLADQAAQALKYAAEQRFVHKDVAARNCLISSSLGLKLSLACMTKEPHQQEYSKHLNQVIPLRWMPREAVFEDEFSAKSDVYAYAVLVWEMFQQGELPFRKLSDESVLAQLEAQTLGWTPPKAAPPALQRLQAKCWSYDPRERPTFEQLAEEIRELARAAHKAD